jgi:hypothetical protein
MCTQLGRAYQLAFFSILGRLMKKKWDRDEKGRGWSSAGRDEGRSRTSLQRSKGFSWNDDDYDATKKKQDGNNN